MAADMPRREQILLGSLAGIGGMVAGMILPQLGGAVVGSALGVTDPSDRALAVVETMEGLCGLGGWVWASAAVVRRRGNRHSPQSPAVGMRPVLVGAGAGALAGIASGAALDLISGGNAAVMTAAGLAIASAPAVGATIAYERSHRLGPPRVAQKNLALIRVAFW